MQVGALSGGSCACVLLDCGEGTVPALQRALGARAAQLAVASLSCCFISHKHADHCLGLPSVLQARPARLPPLLVVAPAAVQVWMQEACPHLMDRAAFVHCASFAAACFTSHAARPVAFGQQAHAARAPQGAHKSAASSRQADGGANSALRQAGFVAGCCVRVRHCYDAYGIVLQHRHGWKVVYSGDTLAPCDALVKAGQNATVLIHEATFADEMAADAQAKRHSTISGALQAAAQMRAWRVVLTHFSQRYSKYAPDAWMQHARDAGSGSGPSNAQQNAMLQSAVPAFDGLFVPFTVLQGLPALSHALMQCFTEAQTQP